ncbi:MAG: hypothetical protein DCC71_12630 [Proteobacteria bacterium]|nr:MAG: hypothetical protein DCC71_12630 [Pseudomonadota bacterium]
MNEGDALARFEAALDPARPEAAPGIAMIGTGEVSAVFALAALPGRVCKRMAGFRAAADAERYAALVRRYVEALEGEGVRVAETAVVPVARPGRAPVVYLLQPALDAKGLGNHLLREADDAALARAIDAVLARVGPLLRANRARRDGRSVTVDAQLSNWHFDAAGQPTLIDVGTPFLRKDGADEIGVELFLAPVPPGMRALYRRMRAVERYLDAFFAPRSLLVDAIANFHKEGRPDRIPLALARVNRWLSEDVAELDRRGGRPIARADVDRYYARDAKTLELYLRARRLDRWLRTRVLRQRYDFVLPGAIRR